MKIYTFLRFVKRKLNTAFFFYKSFFKIYKINKKSPLHAIIVYSYYLDIITPLLLRFIFKIPLLIKAPSDFETLQRELFMKESQSIFSKFLYYPWMTFFKKFVVKKKNIFYQALNEKIYSDFLNLDIPKKNILKLPNAISVQNYSGIKKHENDETHFGFVGRLLKSKNINFLLKSFVKYLVNYPKDKLYIFGEGPERKNIQRFIQNNNLSDNIIFWGFERKKSEIFHNINCLIHPTYGEGCPNTILESILTNTFVIASNVYGIRDIIKHKKLGLLFNPLKEEDLINQLLYYKDNQDLIPQMLEKAKRIVIKDFNVHFIVNSIYEFIKSKWIVRLNQDFFKISIITLVFPYPQKGVMPGVENYVESFAVPLSKLGHKVRIITTYWNGKKKNDNYKEIPITRIFESKSLFGKIGSIFHLNNVTFGLNLLSKKNFKLYQDSDVIIIPLAFGFTGYFKLKKIPVISCFLHYDRRISLVNQFNLPFFHYLEKKQFKSHKNILAISNHSKNDLIRFYGNDKKNIKVIPIGIDIEKFNNSNFSIEIRKKYGNNILLCVGPFLKRKRIDILLKAMPKVIKTIPDAHLILAGEGLLFKNLIKLSRSLGLQNNTSFLGFVNSETLLNLYASSDIFIHPAEFEGFGQVLLEALASGTPCICANKEPMSEIIGDGGITFKVNNSRDLSEKIIDLLKNREKLTDLKKNIGDIIKKYNSNNIAKDWSSYIEKTIKNYHRK